MAYQKLGFAPRQTLTADAMNHIETGIYEGTRTAEETQVSLSALIASLPNTYLTQTNAGTLYLTKSSASDLYLSKSDASSTYLTKSYASGLYLSKSYADTTYLSKIDANNTYTRQTRCTD